MLFKNFINYQCLTLLVSLNEIHASQSEIIWTDIQSKPKEKKKTTTKNQATVKDFSVTKGCTGGVQTNPVNG